MTPVSRKNTAVLVVVCTAVFMLLLDMTIVSAALASIQETFDASLSSLTWIIDAYALPMAGVLLLAATLGDKIGRKNIFIAGLVLFTTASLVCAFSTSMMMLNVTRGFQGLGAALLLGVSLPMISQAFPGAREKAKAIALYGAVMGAGSAAGPILGGALVDTFSWEAIFLINVPLGIVALLVTMKYILPSEVDNPSEAGAVDWIGSVLITGSLTTGVFAVIEGASMGWLNSPVITTLFIVSVSLLTLFIIWEGKYAVNPMIDFSIISRPGFMGVSIGALLTSGTILASTNLLALYLMNTLGYSPFEAGVRALPLTLCTIIGAPLGMTLVHKIRLSFLIPLSIFLISGGLYLMSGLTIDSDWTHFIPGSIFAGIGVGIISAVSSDAALKYSTPEKSGMATGIVSTIRQVGSVFGIALLTVFFSSAAKERASALIGDNIPEAIRENSSAMLDSVKDAIGSGAGLQIMSRLPDQYAMFSDKIEVMIIDSTAHGMNIILIGASITAAVGSLLVASLMYADERKYHVDKEEEETDIT